MACFEVLRADEQAADSRPVDLAVTSAPSQRVRKRALELCTGGIECFSCLSRVYQSKQRVNPGLFAATPMSLMVVPGKAISTALQARELTGWSQVSAVLMGTLIPSNPSIAFTSNPPACLFLLLNRVWRRCCLQVASCGPDPRPQRHSIGC